MDLGSVRYIPKYINKRCSGHARSVKKTGQGHARVALPISHTAAPHSSVPAGRPHPVPPALEGLRQCDSL